MNRLRSAIARWIFGAVVCVHVWEWIGVRHYDAIQVMGSDHKIPMTSAARRCRLCALIETQGLVGKALAAAKKPAKKAAPAKTRKKK